jgi:hypothetical protein
MSEGLRSLTVFVCAVTMSACATTNAVTRNGDGADRAHARDERIEEPRRSFVLPAVEIVGFQIGLNRVDRRLFPEDGVFDVTAESIRRNLRGPWVVDQDAFEVNQFLHPYQGAVYHTIARSTGHSYWPSLAYTFAGSALWEITGETTPPSVNDQITTGIAGTFLGETLFRTANLLIDKSGNRPGPGRMLLVLFISPATAFNRTLFGDHFDAVMPTFDPLYDARLQIGVAGPARRETGRGFRVTRDESVMAVSLEYGMPGKRDYTYGRPFDYFNIEASASTTSGLESVLSQSLLAGRSFGAGANGRGVWGLYGVYDYISPDVFRVSTTAASLGTTVHWWTPAGVGFQATGLAGLGYAAAQTLSGDDDHHYGLAPQISMALRLTGGDRVSLDMGGRAYLVSDLGGYPTPANDFIVRAETSLGLRLFWRHAVSIRYLMNRRTASLVNLGRTRQSRDTVGIFYTLLGPKGFGASR